MSDSKQPMDVPETHHVLDAPIEGPYPDSTRRALFGMGCFWGPEKMFWQLPGVYTTAVGYAGGQSPNPTYEQVCTTETGHAEVVQIIFEPGEISYEKLLTYFWENHDPTQGMRQGADVGNQYRSIILTTSDHQYELASNSRREYQRKLHKAGFGDITTEITSVDTFYFAEPYHQQYLAKNPRGYCPDHGTGVACPMDFS